MVLNVISTAISIAWIRATQNRIKESSTLIAWDVFRREKHDGQRNRRRRGIPALTEGELRERSRCQCRWRTLPGHLRRVKLFVAQGLNRIEPRGSSRRDQSGEEADKRRKTYDEEH